MSKIITTHKELMLEKARLQELLEAQKQLLQFDVQSIKSGLKPASNMLSFLGDFRKKSASNPLLGIAVSLSTDLLMRKLLFKRAGWALKTVLPFVVRKLTTNVVSKAGSHGLLARLVKKVR
jgi:hypothetical protein